MVKFLVAIIVVCLAFSSFMTCMYIGHGELINATFTGAITIYIAFKLHSLKKELRCSSIP